MHRRRKRASAALLGAAALACASPPAPPRTSLPTLAPGDTDASQGWEDPPRQRAADVLAADLLEGPHHRVEGRVDTDGFLRVYTVSSDFGSFRAHGDGMLRVRVAEVRGLAGLQELAGRPEFAAARELSLRSAFVADWKLVTEPVASAAGVPPEAEEALRVVAALAPEARAPSDAEGLAAYAAFEARKRSLANRLGVDPGSSNAALQRELNRSAWIASAGGLPAAALPTAAAAGAAEPGRSATGLGADEVLRAYSAEDLRRLDRLELAATGVPEATTQAFLANPAYSPRVQAQLVAQVAALDPARGRAALIDAALRAASEEDALLYVRTAEVLRVYHERAAPLAQVVAFEGGVLAVTRDGGVVVPLAADYAVWTRPLQSLADALAQVRLAGAGGAPQRRIASSGSFSPRARAELARRGIGLFEHALEPAPGAAPGGPGGSGA